MITSQKALDIAGIIVGNANEDRAEEMHSKVCGLLRADNVTTPDGVMALLGSCVLQVAAQFQLSKSDAETVLCAIMRGAEFKPS
jgi:hypothetical protein